MTDTGYHHRHNHVSGNALGRQHVCVYGLVGGCGCVRGDRTHSEKIRRGQRVSLMCFVKPEKEAERQRGAEKQVKVCMR